MGLCCQRMSELKGQPVNLLKDAGNSDRLKKTSHTNAILAHFFLTRNVRRRGSVLQLRVPSKSDINDVWPMWASEMATTSLCCMETCYCYWQRISHHPTTHRGKLTAGTQSHGGLVSDDFPDLKFGWFLGSRRSFSGCNCIMTTCRVSHWWFSSGANLWSVWVNMVLIKHQVACSMQYLAIQMSRRIECQLNQWQTMMIYHYIFMCMYI